MSRARFRRMVAIILCLLMTISICTVALASDTIFSSYYYYSQNGISYYNYSGIEYNRFALKPRSWTWVVCQSGNAPVGWMGAQGRTYNGSGSLIQSSEWSYNSSSVSSHASPYANGYSGSYENVYSKGSTKAWNGTSYVSYSSYQTLAVTGG